ncbi:MAG: DUF4258 domain-containing protein [Nanoarchaeota archaeon]
MKFEYSFHYIKSKKYRPDIDDYSVEYCIINSNVIKDRLWDDVLNAITIIPPSNRMLKVVYKIKGKHIKILTAYWL